MEGSEMSEQNQYPNHNTILQMKSKHKIIQTMSELAFRPKCWVCLMKILQDLYILDWSGDWGSLICFINKVLLDWLVTTQEQEMVCVKMSDLSDHVVLPISGDGERYDRYLSQAFIFRSLTVKVTASSSSFLLVKYHMFCSCLYVFINRI